MSKFNRFCLCVFLSFGAISLSFVPCSSSVSISASKNSKTFTIITKAQNHQEKQKLPYTPTILKKEEDKTRRKPEENKRKKE